MFEKIRFSLFFVLFCGTASCNVLNLSGKLQLMQEKEFSNVENEKSDSYDLNVFVEKELTEMKTGEVALAVLELETLDLDDESSGEEEIDIIELRTHPVFEDPWTCPKRFCFVDNCKCDPCFLDCWCGGLGGLLVYFGYRCQSFYEVAYTTITYTFCILGSVAGCRCIERCITWRNMKKRFKEA